MGFILYYTTASYTAEELRTEISNAKEEYGNYFSKGGGQGYDGIYVMVGVYGGLQTLIKEHASNANYCHYAALPLNKIVNDAAKHILAVTQVFDNLEKIYTFLAVKKVCPIRWSSRNDGLLAIIEKYSLIMKVL